MRGEQQILPPSDNRILRARIAARTIRQRSLKMVHAAGVGHPGGDLSAADILATLYTSVLRIDPTHPRAPDRDRFVLSKGHASAAFYAVLAHAGFIPQAELDTYAQPFSRLNGHPSSSKLPGVETSTGPLGHGLPVAVGMAIAAKHDSSRRCVIVLTGDGELQEGSNWEAAMFAAHRRLDNLTVIIDRNGLQQGALTEETNRLEDLADRWRAFGWSVVSVDGHSHSQLLSCFDAVPFERARPSCIIARTVKGKGVSFMENRAEWHHRIPTNAELQQAMCELEIRT